MHKDQKRILEAFVPLLEQLVGGDNEDAVRDSMVLNRLFLQGPDPFYLMEACPKAFANLCQLLYLTAEDGRRAILSAHEQGPAILLDDRGGIPLDPSVADFHYFWQDREEWRREGLWLLLASFSDCTEEEYRPSLTMLERIQRATAASTKLEDYVVWNHNHQHNWDAHAKLAEFHKGTEITLDERGFPHVTKDEGFYIAYKAGHKVCVYDTPKGLKFYGTVPSTTLDAEGIVVDKKISEQYGIVFPPELG